MMSEISAHLYRADHVLEGPKGNTHLFYQNPAQFWSYRWAGRVDPSFDKACNLLRSLGRPGDIIGHREGNDFKRLILNGCLKMVKFNPPHGIFYRITGKVPRKTPFGGAVLRPPTNKGKPWGHAPGVLVMRGNVDDYRRGLLASHTVQDEADDDVPATQYGLHRQG